MLKSQIVEATSFNQSRCEISIPKKMSASLKLCNVGVYGGVGYPVDGVIGQLASINKVVLRDGSTVLSQYDRKFNNLMEFINLASTNSKNRNINKSLHASNYGMLLQNGGSTGAANAIGGIVAGELAVRPRVCIDKKNLKISAVTEADSDLAQLDLQNLLGFCKANFVLSGGEVNGVIPFHLLSNPRLTIEFVSDPTTVCANCTTFAQPYLIFDEVVDMNLEDAFVKGQSSLNAQYTDYELESVYLGTATSSKAYLNGFFGKTVDNMIMMVDDGNATPLSQVQDGEQFKLSVNNIDLMNLTSGIDHPGKKACFTRMNGLDLNIVSMGDRVVNLYGTQAADSNASDTSLYEGVQNSLSTETNFYNEGTQSYLVMPILTKINTLKIDYIRTSNNNITLLFWAAVGKIMTFDKNTGATSVSYL